MRLAAEAAFAPLARGSTAWTRGTLTGYDQALEDSFVSRDLKQLCATCGQAFGRGFWLGGALAGAMTATRGMFAPGDVPTERDTEQPLIRTDRAGGYPERDGRRGAITASGGRLTVPEGGLGPEYTYP